MNELVASVTLGVVKMPAWPSGGDQLAFQIFGPFDFAFGENAAAEFVGGQRHDDLVLDAENMRSHGAASRGNHEGSFTAGEQLLRTDSTRINGSQVHAVLFTHAILDGEP